MDSLSDLLLSENQFLGLDLDSQIVLYVFLINFKGDSMILSKNIKN
jgi:hypothetical protein